MTSDRARELLEEFGPNTLASRRVSRWQILARQARGSIFWLLVFAAAVSAALGELVDAAAIVGILVLNAVVAFAEELHSERALEDLRAAAERRARVLRDGQTTRIPASKVVPGDLLLLEPGDIVAADGVIVACRGLIAEEAEVSGEVRPVPKRASCGQPESRDARVLTGSVILSGTANAEVVATGARTEFGKLAPIDGYEEPLTALQQKLDGLGRTLMVVCLGIVSIVALEGLARGARVGHVLLAALSLSVASLPESLGAMVTVALTAAARKLSREGVLVRHLDAVETLGSTTLVCFGKSGTVTTGRLVIKAIEGPSRGELVAAAVRSTVESRPADPVARAIREYTRAEVSQEDGIGAIEETWSADGGALEAVRRSDVWYVRGAPGLVLARCSNGAGASNASRGAGSISDFASSAASMEGKGLWVQAVARGSSPSSQLEGLGLIGFSEAARSKTRRAIAVARRAGMRVVMMTGDHEPEARAIAEEVHLVEDGSGPESATLFTNVTPKQKLERVRRWKAGGEIVAVIGDRMNDAAAVREADVGIAMGNAASDVTFDASDLVLLDDDFSHLTELVKHGRGVHRSLQKSLVYVLAGNLAELLIMLVGSTLGWPEPLLPLQLLWVNLITDSLPAFALALDPPASGVLDSPPRRPDEPMLRRREWVMIVVVGLIQATLALSAFRIIASEGDLARARSVCVAIVVFGEIFWALALTATRTARGRPANSVLLLVVVGSAILHAGLALAPMHNALGRVLHLGFSDVALSVAVGLLPFALVRGRAALKGGSSNPGSSDSNADPKIAI